MTEEERKEIESYLSGISENLKNNLINVKDACRLLLAKAKDIKELKACKVEGEHGIKGYMSFSMSVENSTVNAMTGLLFPSGFDPSNTMILLNERGMDKKDIINYVLAEDKKGTFAGKEAMLNDVFEFIIAARNYDNEHIADSRDLALSTIKEDKISEPDLDAFIAKLNKCGIENSKEAVGVNEEDAHAIIANKSVQVIGKHYDIPRWTKCLLIRPGITEEEKEKIAALWNRDDEGKKEVFEKFFNEIEHADPAFLDVKDLQSYTENFGTYDYLGGLAFDRTFAFRDFRAMGFTMSEQRQADIDLVAECMVNIQNKFNKGLTIMEHPRFKYIKNVDEITTEKAEMLISVYAAEPAVSNDQAKVADRKDALYFANELYTYVGNELLDTTLAKKILNYNKVYTGEERIKHINDWYEQFKNTLAADGIDLDDPVAMARIRAQVPEKEVGGGIIRDNATVSMYMPAMKGMDENFHRKDKPPFADVGWYAANMNSAGNLTPEQIENLYELSRKGKLVIHGKDMSETSARVIYNDDSGKPQISRPLVEVNSHTIYGDISACAKEMFPDAVYPENIYREACNVQGVIRNEVPMITGEDFSYEIDNEEAVRVDYNRTILRDYFENTDKYKSDPDYAEDRAAQIYVVSKYNNSQDHNFMAEYEKYVEENNISFESDEKILTDQEKAIQSLNDARMIGIRKPELTDEMINFVDSLDSVLKENGWDMEIFANRASLRIFTDNNGSIREIPACAPLRFDETKDGFYYDYHSSAEKKKDESPEKFAERYLAQNTAGIKIKADSVKNRGITSSEELRIALIYESAKKGQLLINKPGEPVSAAVPIIPGEDGKARIMSDFDTLGIEERKKDYYINASRMRRLYKDPEEAAKQQYLKKYADQIDVSCYENSAASMASVAFYALSQAEEKGIKSKKDFVDQAMAAIPEDKVDIASFINTCNEDLGLDITFKPRRFSANQAAARKELSEAARRTFLDTSFEKDRNVIYTDEAVKRGVISSEKANELEGNRGLLNVFLDRSTTPGAMENNVEAIRILGTGTTEEKTALYNKCLVKLAAFDPMECFNISDADLIKKWPEIDENMYRLQELIRVNKDLNGKGIHADSQALEKAMDAERYSGDIYLYMTNRIQAIANPAYETVDIDQLMSLEASELNSMARVDERPLKILASNLASAKNGVQLAAASYIENQLTDKFGAVGKGADFYDRNGEALDIFSVYGELKKGNVVYAAGSKNDEVHAFKSEKGRFKADAQPDSKYAKKIRSLTEIRREKRLEAEAAEAQRKEQERQREEEKQQAQLQKQMDDLLQKVEESRVKEEALDDLRYERANKSSEIQNEDYDLGALFDEEPKPAAEPAPDKEAEVSGPENNAEEASKEEKPQQAAPQKSELDILREKTAAYLKEEISYQQFKLGLIIESYAPGKPFGDRPDEYAGNVRECMTQMLAAVRALEQSEKTDITGKELKELGSKDGIKAVKAGMKKEKALKMALDSLSPSGTVDTALIEKFALKADEIKDLGNDEQAEADPLYSSRLDSLYAAKVSEARNFYSTRYATNLIADDLEQKMKQSREEQAAREREEQRKADMKQMAKEAMNKGIGKYEVFSNAMDKFIDDGREALGTSTLNYSLESDANAKDVLRQSLAVLFAAVTVKDIIDSKNMTYEQTRALCSEKGLKNSALEIKRDPGFNEFFKTVRPNAEEIWSSCNEGPEAYREKLKSLLDDYKVKHNEVQRQAGAKKNDQPAAAANKKPKERGLQ